MLGAEASVVYAFSGEILGKISSLCTYLQMIFGQFIFEQKVSPSSGRRHHLFFHYEPYMGRCFLCRRGAAHIISTPHKRCGARTLNVLQNDLKKRKAFKKRRNDGVDCVAA